MLVGDEHLWKKIWNSGSNRGYVPITGNAMQSLNKLKHLKENGYKLFFGHDIQQEKEIRLSPLYYD